MKMNNRFIYGILSIVLAAVIAFIAIPAVTSRTSSTCEIVRMKTAVTRGTLITTEDLELTQISLMGRVTADLEIQTSTNGTDYIQFNAAVNKGYGEHADISFDRFGRIHVEPMTIGSFAEPSGNDAGAGTKAGATEAAEETPPEPSVVDVRVWYELVGQKVLESQITELNANGHTKLTIKENGDIVITSQKKERLKGTLDSFPAKSYWEELVLLLAEDELKAKITGNTLQVSWI